MVKNRKTNNSRVKVTYVDPKTQQVKTVISKPQIIYSEPRKTFKEKYLSPKGELLIKSAKTKAEKDAIWAKYGKNRYTINPNAKPIKTIVHSED